MSLATFKALCIDALDPLTLGTFWAGVLDLELHTDDDGDAYLTGPTPAQTIWVNKVPEAKTVKHRMHLDVNAESVAGVESLGATVLDATTFPWTVMADPEGGEFCVFVRDGAIDRRLLEIVVDTAESAGSARGIATWWADMLGARAVDDDRGFSWVGEIPEAPFDALVFDPVPEDKAAKNRIHLDVTTDHVDTLVGAGATVLRAQDDAIGWTVMADPDGNEFCAFHR
jgi:Glyoxalase-like domain